MNDILKKLEGGDRRSIGRVNLGYLNDESKMVKTFSMQALADFAEQDASLRPQVIKLLEDLTRMGSPAMKSRGRKLLEILQSDD